MNERTTEQHVAIIRRMRFICLFLGCLAAVVTGVLMNHVLPPPSQVSMQGGRFVDMQRSIQVLDHGGPPLLGVNPPSGPKVRLIPPAGSALSTRKGVPGLPGQPYAVGPGDDQGMYLYVPLLAHYFGARDPRVVLRDMYLGLAVLAALLYPLLFFEIFGSLVAAAVAPVALLYVLRDAIPLVDVYWAPALVLLIAVPSLFFLKRRSPWIVVVGLAVVCFFASISDSIRSYTGVGLFIAAIIAAFRWTGTWRRRLVALGVAALALLAVYPLALDGARAYRDQQMGASLTKSASGTHPFWHQIYLGLSYIQPNRFGIEYNDTDGFVTALLYDPTVQAQSPAYEQDVEHAFASIVANDPGYAMADYAEKSTNVVGTAIHIYLAGFLACAIAFLCWKGHRREMTAMWLPILLVTALPPILAVPLDEYELPWLAMVGLAALFAICGPIASIEYWAIGALRNRYPLASSYRGGSDKPEGSRRRSLPVAPTAVAFVAIVLIGAVLDHDSRIWSARFTYSSDATLTQLSSELSSGVPVAHWSFPEGVANWTVYSGAHVKSSASGADVHTGASAYGYQLASPKVSLAPGNYLLEIHGTVRYGGMSAGILDLLHDEWLGGETANFWYAQAQGPGYVMAVQIKSQEQLPVQVVLSNWSPSGGSSAWTVSSVVIARTG
jgi:hypothetical protein